MDDHDREVRASRQLLEGEILTPRSKGDPTGLFAFQLALARWVASIIERRKARKQSNG